MTQEVNLSAALDSILKANKEILEELRKNKPAIAHISREEVEEIVQDTLPKDHEVQHEEIRKFIEHSPEAKVHGAHHDFTESVRVRIEHLIVSIFKGLGGIIIIALLIGLYSWVTHQVGVK